MAMEQQAKDVEAQRQAQADERKLQMEHAARQFEAQTQADLEKWKMEREEAFEWRKAQLDAETKIAVAEIGAKTSVKTAAMSANAKSAKENGTELSDEGETRPNAALQSLVDTVNHSLQANLESNKQLIQAVSRPKRVLRDKNGMVSGVESA